MSMSSALLSIREVGMLKRAIHRPHCRGRGWNWQNTVVLFQLLETWHSSILEMICWAVTVSLPFSPQKSGIFTTSCLSVTFMLAKICCIQIDNDVLVLYHIVSAYAWSTSHWVRIRTIRHVVCFGRFLGSSKVWACRRFGFTFWKCLFGFTVLTVQWAKFKNCCCTPI